MEGYGGLAPCDAGVVLGGGFHASASAARATTPTSERAEEARSDRGARVRGVVLLAAALAVCGLAGWATTTGSSAAPRAASLAAAHGHHRSKSMRSSGDDADSESTGEEEEAEATPAASTDGEVVSFSATNNYTKTRPILEYPWSKMIVEPHRVTAFEALHIDQVDDGSHHSYHWTVTSGADEAAGSQLAALDGRVAEYTFSAVGAYVVRLQLVRASDVEFRETRAELAHDVVAEAAETVACRYVRREIRTLSDTDRDSFMTSLWTVYNVRTEDGAARWGDGYKGIEYFVREHLYGAASRECDHWHDGAGIMTHHVAYSLELEQVLQTIDPSVALPYWEYTYDTSQYGSDWASSSAIFQDDWFGAANPDNAAHAVAKGRWAYTAVMADARNYSDVTNPYGLLRSPWNTNKVPYVTRHGSLYGQSMYASFPACSDVHQCFQSGNLSVMNRCLNGYTHGPVHIMLGGQWSVADATDNYTAAMATDGGGLAAGVGDDDAGDGVPESLWTYSLWKVALLMTKNLWRQGLVSCPSYCASDTPQAECACGAAFAGEAGAALDLDAVDDDVTTDDDVAAAAKHAARVEARAAAQGNGTAAYLVLERAGMMKWLTQYADQVEWDDARGRYVIDASATSSATDVAQQAEQQAAEQQAASEAADDGSGSGSGRRRSLFATDDDDGEGEGGAWADIYAALVNPQLAGEMYTSAAPWDPLFWLVHPTADRMLQYRRLSATRKAAWAFGEVWGYSRDPRAPSDTGIKCEWAVAGDAVDAAEGSSAALAAGGLSASGAAAAAAPTTTTPTLPEVTHGECSGHGSADMLPMLIDGRAMSNLEFFDYMSPLNGSLPYVYDNFRWEHCDAEGFDFFKFGR